MSTETLDQPGAAERLKEAAKRLIAHGGLHAIEIRKLATAANASTSQFHRYFECRDNLLAEVFDEGWAVIERCVTDRLLTPRKSLPEFVEAIANGLLDALEEDEDAVSATVILGFTTINQPARQKIRETVGYERYGKVAAAVTTQLETNLPQAEASIAAELIFGALSRQLLLLTPLYNNRARRVDVKSSRAPFLRLLRRILEALTEVREEELHKNSK